MYPKIIKPTVAILQGVAISVISAIAIAWTTGGLNSTKSTIALGLGILFGKKMWKETEDYPTEKPSHWIEWLLLGAYCWICSRSFLWIIKSCEEEWKIQNVFNLGDISIHLCLINWLAKTTHWWPTNPFFSESSLKYPIGSDLFNALLLNTGIPLFQGLIWCGIIGATLTGITLWRWGGAFTLAALLFNGGTYGIDIISNNQNINYNYEWKNLFLTVFVTQRAFLFALPAGLLILQSWKEELFRNKKPTIPLLGQTILLGSMPLFSIHTTIFLGTAMAILALFFPKIRSKILIKIAAAWPLMLLTTLLISTGAGSGLGLGKNIISWHPGWTWTTTTPFLKFWFTNFGITLPLWIIILFNSIHNKSSPPCDEEKAFVWISSILLGLCLLISFAPWPWDNIKIMIWCWLCITPYFWNYLKKQRPLARNIGCILLFSTGTIAIWQTMGTANSYTLTKKAEVERTEKLVKFLPIEETIATAPDYNHPLTLLGHQTFVGYEGWLWSHGINYRSNLDKLNYFMMGKPNWQSVATKAGVNYIYWGPREIKTWPNSQLPWGKKEGLYRIEREFITNP